DLAQETFVHAFERIEQFGGAARLETWVYRIAINEGLMFLRRRQRGQEILREHAAEQARSRVRDSQADIRLDLEAALAQLPAEDRVLVVLRYYDKMSYADIAQAVNKPAGTVASGLNRARAALRQMLDQPEVSQAVKSPAG